MGGGVGEDKLCRLELSCLLDPQKHIVYLLAISHNFIAPTKHEHKFGCSFSFSCSYCTNGSECRQT